MKIWIERSCQQVNLERTVPHFNLPDGKANTVVVLPGLKKAAAVLLAFLAFHTQIAAAAETYDVVVFGATSGGVIAAVQSARMGKTVVLLEPGRHVGGMTSSGLGWIDIKGTTSVGGMTREFFDRVRRYYSTENVDLRKFGNSDWTVEPHVAEKIFNDLLSETKCQVEFGFRLADVSKTGARITAVRDESGRTVSGKMFIDASYEGDLMARARVTSVIARESSQQYGEKLAGITPEPGTSPTRALKINPYLNPGDPASGLIPLVQPGALGPPGGASPAIQDYNYRLCLTRDSANKIPVEPPADYDPKQYELVGRFCLAAASTGKPISLRHNSKVPGWYFLKMDPIAHGKTDTNNGGWISTDYAGYNQDYPTAGYAAREKIAKAHENYMRGFLHFLATDARVPENVREEMKTWGLAKDEFRDNGGWPFQIYVRQARRLVGEYVMTEHDAERKTHFDDSVGMASYSLDSHFCRRLVDGGIVVEEGGFYQIVSRPYPVSYRALTPKVTECENLLVPACCSASHVAYASIRMEPVFMVLGQSCGTAVVQAIDDKVSVQQIDVRKLQSRLLTDKQVLDLSEAGRQ